MEGNMLVFIDNVSKKENAILELIDRYNIISTINLHFLFKYKPNRYIYMQKLCSKGLVDFKQYPKLKIWFLTDLGRKYIENKEGKKVLKQKKKAYSKKEVQRISKTINIDICINKKHSVEGDITELYSKKYLEAILPENVFQIPDIAFTYLGKFQIAIESITSILNVDLENSFIKFFKTSSYQRIYWVYEKQEEINAILSNFQRAYLRVVTESNAEEMVEIEKSASSHVLVKLEDIYEKGLDATYLSLKQLLPIEFKPAKELVKTH
jgi:hypothetical protein